MAKKLFTKLRANKLRTTNGDIAGTGNSLPVDGTQQSSDGDGLEVGSVLSGGEYTNPDTGADSRADSDSPRRKRGRPAGSGKSSSAKRSETSRSLDSILFSVHMMGAMWMKIPELMLSEDESKMLANAVNKVTELYDIPILSEKSQAWMGLAIAAGTVYGPRLMTAKLNAKQKKPVTKPEEKKPLVFVPRETVNADVKQAPVSTTSQAVNSQVFYGAVETEPIEILE
jgi:hypothetical protein